MKLGFRLKSEYNEQTIDIKEIEQFVKFMQGLGWNFVLTHSEERGHFNDLWEIKFVKEIKDK